MATPKQATGFDYAIELVSQADTRLFQNNPTIASGDWKVSKDYGAFANLATLPTVTPSSTRQVKITLSGTEMTADNVGVQGVDAAGAEWCDWYDNFSLGVRNADNLAFPTTSGRSTDTDAAGNVDARLADAVAHGGTLGSSTATLAMDRVHVNAAGANHAVHLQTAGAGKAALLCEGSLYGFWAYAPDPGIGMAIESDSSAVYLGGTDGITITVTAGHGISIAAAGVGKHDINLVGSGDIYDAVNSRLVSVYGLPARVTKNAALASFPFFMADSTDHVTGKTGLTVTATRSIDGAAFAACANAVSEIANGFYKISLNATDLNGTTIALKFTAAGADPTGVTIVTEPS